MQHILVVRTDRIGDVILTLPTVEAIKKSIPNVHVAMLVNSYTAALADGITDIYIYQHGNKQRPFFKLVAELRHEQFDAAVVAYPRFRIALLLWLAGIPVRIGTGYRWYSFLFNKKIFEHRKTVKKHEAEYNLSLLKGLGIDPPSIPAVTIALSDEERKTAQDIRRSLGISDDGRLVFIHPGTGGSARHWKPEHFGLLAAEIYRREFQVVITGGSTESDLVKRVAQSAGSGVKSFVSTLGLKEFAALIETAQLFIAHSTGPLHIAAVVGVPVVGLYPPDRVMSPKRWGPLTEKKAIFVPESAKCSRCKGGRCQGNDCMEQITVQQVLDASLKLINIQKTPSVNGVQD